MEVNVICMDPCTKIVSCAPVPSVVNCNLKVAGDFPSLALLEQGGGALSTFNFPPGGGNHPKKKLSERLGESFGTNCKVSRSAAFGSLTLSTKVPGNPPSEGEKGKKQMRRITSQKNAYGLEFVNKDMWNPENADNTLLILDRNMQSFGRLGNMRQENGVIPNRHGGSCQYFSFPACVRCHIHRFPHCRHSKRHPHQQSET